jgi:hypothetical protein
VKCDFGPRLVKEGMKNQSRKKCPVRGKNVTRLGTKKKKIAPEFVIFGENFPIFLL